MRDIRGNAEELEQTAVAAGLSDSLGPVELLLRCHEKPHRKMCVCLLSWLCWWRNRDRLCSAGAFPTRGDATRYNTSNAAALFSSLLANWDEKRLNWNWCPFVLVKKYFNYCCRRLSTCLLTADNGQHSRNQLCHKSLTLSHQTVKESLLNVVAMAGQKRFGEIQ